MNEMIHSSCVYKQQCMEHSSILFVFTTKWA